jgi:hypothetical protein
MRRPTTLAPFFLAIAALPPAARPQAPDTPKRVVIPFDFVSKFDDGEYGRTIGEMLWTKLRRQGGFVLPESMQDVRDWCQRARMVPGPETPMARMQAIVAREQAGDIGIWGRVERVAGSETDVYDLWIAIADFSVDPPRMIYQKQARTRTVSEIPHIYIKEALDTLYARPAPAAAVPDSARDGRWKKFPSLVPGDFERGRAAPMGWGPLPHDATWVTEKDQGGRSKNRVVRFTMTEDVAGTTGVLYYSDFFRVDAGATYRFQCRWKSSGSAAKVFVKCYDDLPTDTRTAPGAEPSKTERREVYRSQQNLEGRPGAWNVHTEDFTPEHPRFTPRWGRVMLYAYWPAGTVEWDDVAVKRIADPPAVAGGKDHRPSPAAAVPKRNGSQRAPSR